MDLIVKAQGEYREFENAKVCSHASITIESCFSDKVYALRPHHWRQCESRCTGNRREHASMSGNADSRFPLPEQRPLVASPVHLHKTRPLSFFFAEPQRAF